MYVTEIFNTNYTSIHDIISLQNVINLLLFLLLTFLGSAARVSIDIELTHKKIKRVSFFNRWFIATVLSYIIEIFISEKEFLRKYYSEVIILFCIFVNDIISFIIINIFKIFMYLLNGFTKGILDLRNVLNKDKNTDINEK